ncbi:tyrosine-type recombinase/integrase [bacterium]|nr:tyrosine-type recombinase/integrase [bacterium]
MDSRTVRKALDRLCRHLRITGRVSAHSFRKTFAYKIHELLGHDLFATQHALGHSQVAATVCYLSVRSRAVEAAIMRVLD